MTSLLDTIEHEAIREGRPVLYAVLATALARWFGQPDTLGALMERAYLFTARERAVLARGIGQVRTIAELVGRAKTQIEMVQVSTPGVLGASAEFAQKPKRNRKKDAAQKLNPKRAFKLKPQKALAYFKALSPARRTPLPPDWLDTHRRDAFTMAEVTERATLKRVHSLVSHAIDEGKITTRDFKVSLEDLGVTSKNPQYAEMVFRTNALDSYNKGYYDEVHDDPDLGEYFPYWEYLAVEDDRISDEHDANLRGGDGDGSYYPAERSFDAVRGDRIFNCRCSFRWIDKFEAVDLGLLDKREAERALGPPAERVRDPRLPSIGSSIVTKYKGVDRSVEVTKTGFRYEGRTYKSLTAVAKSVTGARAINGYKFFGLTGPKPLPPKEIKPLPKKKVEPRPKHMQDPRIPIEGETIQAVYRGAGYTAKVVREGFEYQAKVYKSVSAVGKAITGRSVNGYKFFGLKAKAALPKQVVTMRAAEDIRKAFLEKVPPRTPGAPTRRIPRGRSQLEVGKFLRELEVEGGRAVSLTFGGMPETDVWAARHETIPRAMADIRTALSNSVKLPKTLYVDILGIVRPGAIPGRISLSRYGSRKVFFHEFGHEIEYYNPKVQKAAQEFFNMRTKGQKLRKLADVKFGDYRPDEVCKPDGFTDAYTGKVYQRKWSPLIGHYQSSEIVSMGLQEMLTDPARFARKDPGHFDLIVDILRGVYS